MKKRNIAMALLMTIPMAIGAFGTVSVYGKQEISAKTNYINNDDNYYYLSPRLTMFSNSFPYSVKKGDSGKIVKTYINKQYKFKDNLYKSDSIFTSSDPNVIQIDNEGNWKALRDGRALISLRVISENSQDFGKELKERGISNYNRYDISKINPDDKATVYLRYAHVGEFKPYKKFEGSRTSFRLDTKSISSKLRVGDKGKINKIYDNGAINEYKTDSEFLSSNDKVLKIDQDGNFEAVSPGVAEISAVVKLPKEYELNEHGFTSPDVIDEQLVVTKSIKVKVYKDVNSKADLKKVKDGVYRLYNPNNYEHFYTTNFNEVSNLLKIGWGRYEGVAWLEGNKEPIYRLYNPVLKDHHYTMDKNEIKTLTSKYGWIFEKKEFSSGGNIPVYRLFNKNLISGSHHYTTDKNEVNILKSRGWTYEGIAWMAK